MQNRKKPIREEIRRMISRIVKEFQPERVTLAEQVRGSNFLRLANALSALYPREGEEKRLLDAMLLATPRR